jgi:hypothetical protein
MSSSRKVVILNYSAGTQKKWNGECFPSCFSHITDLGAPSLQIQPNNAFSLDTSNPNLIEKRRVNSEMKHPKRHAVIPTTSPLSAPCTYQATNAKYQEQIQLKNNK